MDDEEDSTIVIYDGSKSFEGDTKVTGFTVATNITTIGVNKFSACPKLASLGEMREGVSVIEHHAFYACPLLTTLQGLPSSVNEISWYAFSHSGITSLDWLPSAVTAIGVRCFSYCAGLTSIGPGFSPDCHVHSTAFVGCSALVAAAQDRGFATAVEWGKHHWLDVHRSVSLAAVRRARPALPDVLVRVIMNFAGIKV